MMVYLIWQEVWVCGSDNYSSYDYGTYCEVVEVWDDNNKANEAATKIYASRTPKNKISKTWVEPFEVKGIGECLK